MKSAKRVGALLLSVCIILGLGACGSAATSANQSGQSSTGQESKKSKSNTSGKSDGDTTKKAEPEGRIVSNWREVYHCADSSEYGSLPDFDQAGKVMIWGDCVIIATDQTVTVPVMDAPSHNGEIKVSDRLLGELPVTFNSSDIGSWNITVDASNLKPVTLTSVNKEFSVQAEVCHGGSCPNPLQDSKIAFGKIGTINITGGTTVAVRFYIAGGGDVTVIRRG